MLRRALDRLKWHFISGRFSTDSHTASQRPVDWAPVRDLHQTAALLVREITI